MVYSIPTYRGEQVVTVVIATRLERVPVDRDGRVLPNPTHGQQLTLQIGEVALLTARAELELAQASRLRFVRRDDIDPNLDVLVVISMRPQESMEDNNTTKVIAATVGNRIRQYMDLNARELIYLATQRPFVNVAIRIVPYDDPTVVCKGPL